MRFCVCPGAALTHNGLPMRPILLAPFGHYTRYILRSHFRHTAVILLALLCIALAVDLPPQISKLLAGAAGGGVAGKIGRLAWFMALRSADLLPRFIPLAAFLGVLWTQVVLVLSRERLLVWNTGRSALQCLVPVLVLAGLLGCIQYVCDTQLRPAAVAAQIRDRLGNYGERFDRGLSKESHWIDFGNDLLHARLVYGPPVVMREVTVYRLNENGRLREVDNANSAVPAGDGAWLLQQGSYWNIPAESASGPASVALFTRGTGASAIRFQQRRIALAANPLWLSVWGIYPQYLSQNTLQTLVANLNGDRRALFMARLQFNRANALMPGAMALLAEMLCMMLFVHGVPLHLQVAMIPAGYGGHLAMQTFLLMGEHDYANPVAAPWLTPIGLLLAAAGLLAAIELRRRNGGKIGWDKLLLARTQPLLGVRCTCSTCPFVSSRP